MMAIQQASMTPAEWKAVKEDLNRLYHSVWLDCDGYVVNLCLERVGAMQLGIHVFVNGWFKGEWMMEKEPSEEARRFYPLRTRAIYRGKQRKAIKRVFGKKQAEKVFTYRLPHWTSVNSLQRHFVKHNQCIRRLTKEQADAMRTAQTQEESPA
jgi:hypothetical protein